MDGGCAVALGGDMISKKATAPSGIIEL